MKLPAHGRYGRSIRRMIWGSCSGRSWWKLGDDASSALLVGPLISPIVLAAVHGMQLALRSLEDDGRLDETGPVASFRERQRLVRKGDDDALEQRYARREE